MAELGEYLAFGSYTDQATPPGGALPQVPTDHLDYGYVDKCQSIPELQAILQVLKSGKEGHYAQLEQHVEKKLLALLPEKTRKQIDRLRQEPTPIEISEAEQELRQWQDQINKQDSKLKMTRVTVGCGTEQNASVFDDACPSSGPGKKRMPPVRGTSQKATVRAGPSSSSTAAAKPAEKRNGDRLSGYDWRAWEKYDVDKVCAELDEEEQAVWQEGEKAKRELQEREAVRRRAYLKELGDLAEKLGVSEHDEVERKVFALREKQKGNECFRAGQNGEAHLYYSKSLAWDPTSAVVYGNRAVACVKLEKFEQAEADCSMALERDPNYQKARIRRGTTRYRRGKYREAVEDFEEVLRAIGPDGDARQKKEVSALLEKARAKLIEVEGEAAAAKLKPVPAAPSATKEKEDGLRTVPIQAGYGPPECPPGWSRTLLAEGTLTAPAASATAKEQAADEKPTGMRRVAIVEEEDEEEEEGEDQQQSPVVPAQEATRSELPAPVHDERKAGGSPPPPAPTGGGGGMRRVAIVEEDDDEDAEEQAVPPPSTAAAGATTRVPIIEEEEEEEEEEAEKDTADQPKGASAPATADAEQDKGGSGKQQQQQQQQQGEEVFRRVPIEDDDDNDEDEQPAVSAAQEADRLKEEGNKALQSGDVRKALDLYTASLAKHATGAARNNRALARLKLQDWSGAEEDAAAVVAQEPKNVKALFRRGKARLGRAQATGYSPSSAMELVKTAIQDMDAVLAIEPNNRPAKQEKQVAQQLLSKLQQQAAAPKPPTQARPPAPSSSSSLLDSITGKAATAADSSSLLKEVSSKPRAPAPAVDKQDAITPPPPAVSATPAEPPAAAAKKLVAVQDAEEPRVVKQQEEKEGKAKEAPEARQEKVAATAAPTAPQPAPASRAVPAVRVTVPKAAPKNMYELETAWRSLRRDPAKLAQYLKLFKPATFLKVFKQSANPDVVSDVFACVAEQMVEQDPPAALTVLDSISRVGHFNMMCLMFSSAERDSLANMFDRLQAAATDAQAFSKLRSKYGV